MVLGTLSGCGVSNSAFDIEMDGSFGKKVEDEADKFYIYSWNDELKSRLEYVFEVYPELRDQVEYVEIGDDDTYQARVDRALRISDAKDYPDMMALEAAYIMKALCCDTTVMTKLAGETMDYVNNKAAMQKLSSGGKGAYEFLGGQDFISAFLPLADEVDVSWMSAYDETCNNMFSSHLGVYKSGGSDLETTIANFKQEVSETFPKVKVQGGVHSLSYPTRDNTLCFIWCISGTVRHDNYYG